MVLVGALVMALAFAAPFLLGVQNLMGLAIIAIGLFEAWRVNRRVPLVIEGPFRVGESPPGAASV